MEAALEGVATKIKPPRWWIAVVIVAGFAGAIAALMVGGSRTYTISPMRVELSAKPAFGGQSQLAVRPGDRVRAGHATANTHASPITFRMTVLDVDLTGIDAGTGNLLASPETTARHIRFSEDGRKAISSFGMWLGILGVTGGAIGGAAVSFGRWKRILGGALAGAVLLGILGLLMHQTYDVAKFAGTTYQLEQPGVDAGD